MCKFPVQGGISSYNLLFFKSTSLNFCLTHAQGLFLEGLNPYFIIQIGNIFS